MLHQGLLDLDIALELELYNNFQPYKYMKH